MEKKNGARSPGNRAEPSKIVQNDVAHCRQAPTIQSSTFPARRLGPKFRPSTDTAFKHVPHADEALQFACLVAHSRVAEAYRTLPPIGVFRPFRPRRCPCDSSRNTSSDPSSWLRSPHLHHLQRASQAVPVPIPEWVPMLFVRNLRQDGKTWDFFSRQVGKIEEHDVPNRAAPFRPSSCAGVGSRGRETQPAPASPQQTHRKRWACSHRFSHKPR